MRSKWAALTVALTLGLLSPAEAVELQGHRGARGLFPENTIPAFKAALKYGVDVLELDIGITRDNQVVVSHDPALNISITQRDGKWIDHPLLIKDMTVAELQTYDVGQVRPGSRYGNRFHKQTPVPGTTIPTLRQVFEMPGLADGSVHLNIETKINPSKPGNTVSPDQMAKTLVAEIQRAGWVDKVTIQSFDWRTLKIVNTIAPKIPTVCLTAQQSWLDNVGAGSSHPSPWLAGHDIRESGGSVPKLVKSAGCAIWSPYHKDLSAPLLAEAHGLGLKVVVWTVNKKRDIERLIALGVDGIITDYPNIARDVIDQAK